MFFALILEKNENNGKWLIYLSFVYKAILPITKNPYSDLLKLFRSNQSLYLVKFSRKKKQSLDI